MRRAGVQGLSGRPRFRLVPGVVTAADRVQREFHRDQRDELWVTDITEHRTREGKVYCAVVLDAWSRRVVGWSIDSTLSTALVTNALRMAIEQRQPRGATVIHSDQGTQAGSKVLESRGVRSSLSRPGNCWDNAVAESFFSTLKLDLLYRHSWPTRAAARSAIFEYIEAFYNRERRHSTLGNLSPADYESAHAAVCSGQQTCPSNRVKPNPSSNVHDPWRATTVSAVFTGRTPSRSGGQAPSGGERAQSADVQAWWSDPPEAVARALRSDASLGLAAAEADQRRRDAGPNELTERPRRPAWRMAVDQVANTIIMVLIVAALVTIFVGDPRDTVVISVVVLLNGAIGFYQEHSAEQAMAALKRLAVSTAHIIRGGEPRIIASRDVVPGDLLRLEAGDVVAADARLVESPGLRINEAPLTGESVPVDKDAGAVVTADAPLADRSTMVFKGTAVAAGRGLAIVTATGMLTELGHIARLLEGQAPPTPMQRRLSALGRQIAIAACALCGVVFLIGVLRGESWTTMLLTAVSLAVAAIPESLPAVVTISMALGAQRMARQHAVIRKLLAVETLGSVTVIGTDKTGTLTRGEMLVEWIWTADGGEYRVEGDGYAPSGTIVPTTDIASSSTAFHRLLEAAALCNDAAIVAPRSSGETWACVGDPTEAALLAAAGKGGVDRTALLRAHPRRLEIAFDARRRRMTTVHGTSHRNLIATKGALEAVIPLCASASEAGEAAVSPVVAEARRRAHEYGERGYRVLAVAGTHRDGAVLPGQEESFPLTLYGLVAMTDPPRAEAAAAVAAARGAGVRTVMISGDHPTTARAIAARLGILDQGTVMTGAELAAEAAAGRSDHLRDVAVFARTSSEQKLDIVAAWQAAGEIVAMTGDGVNDAPALRRADIGVAMGVNGTEVSKEASDMVLADDNFATIVMSIREGRRIYDNIRRFVRYGLTGGSAEVWVMLAGPLLGMPLPLLPVQILWVNLLTHGLPGLALGVEAAEPDAMSRPPRAPREKILGRGLWEHIGVMGVVMAAVTLGLGVWERSHNGPWQTMLFTALAFLQLGNALAVRSERVSVFSLGLLSNRFLASAVLGTLALQLGVIYWGPAQRAFATEPLGVVDLLTVLAVSTAAFWAVEAEKLVRRRHTAARARRTALA
jgi:P-type Ca2+ transporter type 2C